MFLSQFEIFCDLNRPIETWNSSVLYIKDIFLNEANLMSVLQLIDKGRTGGGGGGEGGGFLARFTNLKNRRSRFTD